MKQLFNNLSFYNPCVCARTHAHTHAHGFFDTLCGCVEVQSWFQVWGMESVTMCPHKDRQTSTCV